MAGMLILKLRKHGSPTQTGSTAPTQHYHDKLLRINSFRIVNSLISQKKQTLRRMEMNTPELTWE
jgi:hypothetical protein